MASPLFRPRTYPLALAAPRVASQLKSGGEALLATATADALVDTAALRAKDHVGPARPPGRSADQTRVRVSA